MAHEAQDSVLIDKCADYPRNHYGEELLEWDILQDDVDEGDGKLVMDCVVRAGASRSRWQKTFTFKAGSIKDMTWQYLG